MRRMQMKKLDYDREDFTTNHLEEDSLSILDS